MSELTVGTISGLAANGYVVDVASGSQLTQPGMVLQVVSTTKTDTFSTSSTSYVDITGLNASITPISNSSNILVLYSIMSGENPNAFANIRLLRDSTPIGIGETVTGKDSLTISSFTGGQTNAQTVSAGNFLDSPATLSLVTYKFQLRSAGGTGTQYINRNTRDDTGGYDPRGISTITLMEIAQ